MPRRWGPTHFPFTPSRKLKKELPPSFQSIQAKREDLYIVTETLKTKRTETLKYETQFDVQILLKMFGFQREHEVRISGDRDCGRASLAHTLRSGAASPDTRLLISSSRLF